MISMDFWGKNIPGWGVPEGAKGLRWDCGPPCWRNRRCPQRGVNDGTEVRGWPGGGGVRKGS